MPVIFLDDVVISVKNNGFSVDDFVGYVKKDTTFYMGFKHLRYYFHNYESELNIFNKKGKVIGTLKKQGTHHSNDKRHGLLMILFMIMVRYLSVMESINIILQRHLMKFFFLKIQ